MKSASGRGPCGDRCCRQVRELAQRLQDRRLEHVNRRPPTSRSYRGGPRTTTPNAPYDAPHRNARQYRRYSFSVLDEADGSAGPPRRSPLQTSRLPPYQDRSSNTIKVGPPPQRKGHDSTVDTRSVLSRRRHSDHPARRSRSTSDVVLTSHIASHSVLAVASTLAPMEPPRVRNARS